METKCEQEPYCSLYIMYLRRGGKTKWLILYYQHHIHSMLSFYQYENYVSKQILHTGPLKLQLSKSTFVEKTFSPPNLLLGLNGRSCEGRILKVPSSSFLWAAAGFNWAENPSRNHPGSPRCCCAGSLREAAAVGPLSEAASQLRQRKQSDCCSASARELPSFPQSVLLYGRIHLYKSFKGWNVTLLPSCGCGGLCPCICTGLRGSCTPLVEGAMGG